ncbi:MAG: right-handed parallel beta-helix repeat-containing protein [Myxococcota bacterium]
MRLPLLSSCALAALLFACPAPPSTCDGSECAPDASVDAGLCAPGTFRTATGECHDVSTPCAAGFERDPSGWGCVASLAACDAGAISVPGEGCTAVGWSTCPAGFTHDGWSCEPTLPATACTGATRAALGASSCVPVGDCAATFPPTAATLFVDATLDGGDATHFATITAALAAAPAGATIAIAPGTYREALTPTRAVKLVGRCPAQVQLIGSPAVFANGVAGVEVEGVTIRESLLAARVELGGQLTLRHAVLEANQRSAVQVLDPGSRATLEDVVVRDTQPDPSTQTFGQGVAASFGAQLTLTDVELSGNRETSLFLDRAQTTATVTRTVISNTLPRASTGRLGWGVGVQRGAALTAERVVVQDSRTSGLVVSVAPSTATLTDSLVRRTAAGLDNTGQPSAVAVAVLQGATLTWTRGAADGSPGTLIHAQDPGSTLHLTGVTARNVTQTAGLPPSGIDADDSARASLDHVAVVRTAGSALFASSSGELSADHVGLFDVAVGLRAQQARLTGTAVEVRRHGDVGALALQQGTLSLSRCTVAEGTTDLALGGASSELGLLTLERCVVSRATSAGVYAKTSGAVALVTDSVIEGTQLTLAGEYGQGVVVEAGATANLDRVTVAGNHTAGLQLADATSALTATHVTVRGTLANGAGTRGRGANANFGGALTLNDSALVDNRQVGLFAFQSTIEATGCAVLGTKSDPDGAYGNGLEALTDGRIFFRAGAVEASAGIAAVFAEGAGVLEATRVAKNTIGLHAQDGSTVEELASVPASLGARQVVVTSSTVFEDNQAKLSAVTVPVPPP